MEGAALNVRAFRALCYTVGITLTALAILAWMIAWIAAGIDQTEWDVVKQESHPVRGLIFILIGILGPILVAVFLDAYRRDEG